MLLSIRERILTIRLLEKVSKHPIYAKSLGIEGEQLRRNSGGSKLSDVSESCNQVTMCVEKGENEWNTLLVLV